MDQTFLVSVIIPIFNVENYLDKCVESVVTQTYSNLEIILIDDGSTDFSSALCDKWKERDDRITVIHKKNGGLSDARNAGLKIAKGIYFAFIDSDDYIAKSAIESMLNSAVSSSSEIAVCNMIRYTPDGTKVPFYAPVHTRMLLSGEQRYETLEQPSVCNKLFKAELFENILFPTGKYYEDTFIYHRLLYKARNVVLTGEDSYWYLLRNDSIVGDTKLTDRYFDFIEAVWERTVFLKAHEVKKYDQKACLSLYAAMANAEKNIEKTSSNREKFKCAHKQYDIAYKTLMRTKREISCKQKIRLFLLKYFPMVHSKIY